MAKPILPVLATTLGTRYVKANDIMEAISLALVAKMNLILFGPGGHAKSEIASEVANMVERASSGVIMFGEGMTEDKLWGGINLNKLNDPEDKRIEYYLEKSFLSWDIAVFEEIFDAPVNVLMALKYVLTSGEYRSGWQHHPMKTFSIIAATNREPHEIANMGPSAQALIERFIQLRVVWEDYSNRDFAELFHVVENRAKYPTMTIEDLRDYQRKASEVFVPSEVKHTLAEIIGSATTKGINISPRTAVMCLKLIRASAAICDRDAVVPGDITSIKFLPGCEELTANMANELKDAEDRAQADEVVKRYTNIYTQLENDFNVCVRTPIKLLQLAKKIDSALEDLSRCRFPESRMNNRASLMNSITNLKQRTIDEAMNQTRESK